MRPTPVLVGNWRVEGGFDHRQRGFGPTGPVVVALKRGGGVPALVVLADVHVRLGRDQRGDAWARALRRALSLYERALASDPHNEVAKSGRDYVRRMMNRSPGDDSARPSTFQMGTAP